MIKENPDIGLYSRKWAKLFGFHESAVLMQIQYWLDKNRKLQRNFREGFFWTYNSYEEWQEQFNWWHKDTLGRILRKLEKSGALVSKCFNKDCTNRKKWYRIDYDRVAEIEKLSPLGYSMLYNDYDNLSCTIDYDKKSLTRTRADDEIIRDESWEVLQAAGHMRRKYRKRGGHVR